MDAPAAGAGSLTAVLDAWAIVALVQDEPAAGTVEETIESGRALVSWINLGEAYHVLIGRFGESAAATAVEGIARSVVTEEPDHALVLSAARIKAAHRVSYADAFAVATAERHRAPLLTGDLEIVTIDRALLELVDLRS